MDDAADNIAGTSELVQMILENLEVHDLIVATRVCEQSQRQILSDKHLRKRLVLRRINATGQGSLVQDRIYRYGLEYRNERPGVPPIIVARGTLLVSLRKGIETVLRVWHQRHFVLRERFGVYRHIEGNVLKYSSDHSVRIESAATNSLFANVETRSQVR